jgi:hypothetical protein
MTTLINKNGTTTEITDAQLDARLDVLMAQPKTTRYKENGSSCIEINDGDSVAIIAIDLTMKEINFVPVTVNVSMISGSTFGSGIHFFEGLDAVINAKKYAMERYNEIMNNWN